MFSLIKRLINKIFITEESRNEIRNKALADYFKSEHAFERIIPTDKKVEIKKYAAKRVVRGNFTSPPEILLINMMLKERLVKSILDDIDFPVSQSRNEHGELVFYADVEILLRKEEE